MVSGQTIEPTNISGFNQFYDDIIATESRHYGLGLDRRLSDRIYTGVEFARRNNDEPVFDGNTGTVSRYEWNENVFQSYLFFALSEKIVLSGQYAFERLKSDDRGIDPDLYFNIKTHRVPLEVCYFHDSGFSSSFKATYFHQDYDGKDTQTAETVSVSDRFWVCDAEFAWRLPKGKGRISFVVKNLFDKDFLYQDTDPYHPEIHPERQMVLNVTFRF